MALPKRAASALTAADEVHDQPPPGPRPGIAPVARRYTRSDRPHVRDAGPVEPDGEEEEPQAEGDEGGGPSGGGGAVLHGCCSWRRLPGGRCQSGHRAYRGADLHTSSAPTLALFFVRLLREGQVGAGVGPGPGSPRRRRTPPGRRGSWATSTRTTCRTRSSTGTPRGWSGGFRVWLGTVQRARLLVLGHIKELHFRRTSGLLGIGESPVSHPLLLLRSSINHHHYGNKHSGPMPNFLAVCVELHDVPNDLAGTQPPSRTLRRFHFDCKKQRGQCLLIIPPTPIGGNPIGEQTNIRDSLEPTAEIHMLAGSTAETARRRDQGIHIFTFIPIWLIGTWP